MGLRLPIAVYLAVLGAALVIAGTRLRELALGEAPLALWMPFARPLFSSAFEVALLVGVPAAVLGAQARGLQSRSTALLGLALAGLSTLMALLLAGDIAPGRLAQELVDAARASCPQAPERRVDVPLVSAAWTCPHGGRPRVSGATPQLGKARFQATSLRVSDDLRQLELADFLLEVPAAGERPAARLTARAASIRGLSPWGRPADVPLGTRLLTALLGVGATVLAGLYACAGFRAGFLAAVGLGVGAGLSAVVVQRFFDRMGLGATSYLFTIPIGGLAVLALALVAAAGRFFLRRWQR